MNLDEHLLSRRAAPLLAAERARLAAQRSKWDRYGARWPFWAALLSTLMLALAVLP